MRAILSVLALGAVSLTASLAANAAVEITMDHTSPDGNKSSPETMYLSDDGMKMDMGRNTMIYRSSGSMLVLNNDKHSYMDLSDMAKQMSAAQAQMEAHMKDMPEAQRKQMEAMMAKMGAPTADAGPGPTYEKAGSSTIGSWSCQLFHVTYSNDMKVDECIAKVGDVGLTAADLKIFEKFTDTMRQSMPFGKGRDMPMDFSEQTKAIGFEGVPVDTTVYSDGKSISHTTFKSIAHDPIPAGTFDLPAGYTKQEMGDMGRRPAQ